MQMRNLACALLLSHGVPMLQMGDEYGHSKVRSVLPSDAMHGMHLRPARKHPETCQTAAALC